MPARTEIYESIIMAIGLALIIAAAMFLPKGSALQWFGIGSGVVLIIFETVILEVMFELVTMSYPYLRVELHPSGRTLHAFLEGKPFTRALTKTINSTRFTAHWEQNHPYYGKFKDFEIHHELDFWERAPRTRGLAFFKGYAIPHSDVHRVVCYEYPYGADRFKDKTVPAFMLAFAHGGDVNFVPLPLSTTFRAVDNLVEEHPEMLMKANPGISIEKLLSFATHYDAMQYKYLEKTREANFYRSECIRLEGAEQSRDSLSRGLLEIPRDTSKLALQQVHGWYEECGAFDRIIKKYGKAPFFRLSKLMVMLILAVVGIGAVTYLVVNQDVRVSVGAWISVLGNQILLAFLVLSALVAIYLVRRRKAA